MTFISVDFPAPFGPSIAQLCPNSVDQLMFLRIGLSQRRFETLWREIKEEFRVMFLVYG
jgi:hypothetical protein